MTTVFSVRDDILLNVIKDTLERGIRPQQCSMYCKFSLRDNVLYKVTIYDTGRVSVKNTKNNREQPYLVKSITDAIEGLLISLLIEQETTNESL